MSPKGVLWFVIIMLVLAAAGGAYYYYTNIYLPAQEPVEEPVISTAQVSRGDLVITASGSGSLVPSSEVALGFPSGGVLAELLVEVGDRVEAGQLLARLDDADIQDQIAQAEISLQQAGLDLAELIEEADPARWALFTCMGSGMRSPRTRPIPCCRCGRRSKVGPCRAAPRRTPS